MRIVTLVFFKLVKGIKSCDQNVGITCFRVSGYGASKALLLRIVPRYVHTSCQHGHFFFCWLVRMQLLASHAVMTSFLPSPRHNFKSFSLYLFFLSELERETDDRDTSNFKLKTRKKMKHFCALLGNVPDMT